VTPLRAEKVEYTDEGAELSIQDYWVDPSRASAVLDRTTTIPLTHLGSKYDVDVFAFRDEQAIVVVAVTHAGVIIDAQSDQARCAHARGSLSVNPKDGGILRFLAAVVKPGAPLDLDENQPHNISSEDRFRQWMTGVNVTVSISQLSRDRSPIISAVVGRADDNTMQFMPGFISFDHYVQLAHDASLRKGKRKKRQAELRSARKRKPTPAKVVSATQVAQSSPRTPPSKRVAFERKRRPEVPPAPIAATVSTRPASPPAEKQKVTKMRFRSTAE
jgi:hypothetical protein